MSNQQQLKITYKLKLGVIIICAGLCLSVLSSASQIANLGKGVASLTWGVGISFCVLGTLILPRHRSVGVLSTLFSLAGSNLFRGGLYGADTIKSVLLVRQVLDGAWYGTPLSHVYFATIYQVTGAGFFRGVMLGVTAALIPFGLSVIYWVRRVTPKQYISFALLGILTNWFLIEFHTFAAKETIGLPLAIYTGTILLKAFDRHEVRLIILATLFSFALVLAHHLSALIPLLIVTATFLIAIVRSTPLRSRLIPNNQWIIHPWVLLIFVLIVGGYWTLVFDQVYSLGLTPVVHKLIGVSAPEQAQIQSPSIINSGQQTIYQVFQLNWRGWKVMLFAPVIIIGGLYRAVSQRQVFNNYQEFILAFGSAALAVGVLAVFTTYTVASGWRFINFAWLFIIPLFILIYKDISPEIVVKIIIALFIVLNVIAWPAANIDPTITSPLSHDEWAFNEGDVSVSLFTVEYGKHPYTISGSAGGMMYYFSTLGKYPYNSANPCDLNYTIGREIASNETSDKIYTNGYWVSQLNQCN
ncbi:hypothetical protein ACOZ4B_08820 [Haloferax prahovense]|uniref:hypothetical protein n=1 Tax=Haloferax prahovense TaxID=381852 RepID=UPI003C73EADC